MLTGFQRVPVRKKSVSCYSHDWPASLALSAFFSSSSSSTSQHEVAASVIPPPLPYEVLECVCRSSSGQHAEASRLRSLFVFLPSLFISLSLSVLPHTPDLLSLLLTTCTPHFSWTCRLNAASPFFRDASLVWQSGSRRDGSCKDSREKAARGIPRIKERCPWRSPPGAPPDGMPRATR